MTANDVLERWPLCVEKGDGMKSKDAVAPNC